LPVSTDRPTFLGEPPASVGAEAAFAGDREDDGYVANLTRLWAWRPDVLSGFGALRAQVMDEWALTDRDRAVLVAASASERGDSYCSLAWGARLAELTDDETAARVLADEPAPGLSERESALASWARQVVRDPNATTEADVARLRKVGLDDRAIFEATAFIAFRLAFSTVNDALGAAPDRQLADAVPTPVRDAVSYGRAPLPEPSRP
jgi:uncharacterized peroxidase-related enzyme